MTDELGFKAEVSSGSDDGPDAATGDASARPVVPSTAFARALATRRAARATATTDTEAVLVGVEDFIPDIPPDPLTEYQAAVNAACGDITFQEVFEKLQFMGIILGSAKPIGSWRGDSNKFFCPDPSHDNAGGTMSAWGSKDKGTWYCPKGCGQGSGGGDKFTLARYLFPGRDFHEIANLMAATFRGIAKPEILKEVSAAPVAPTEVSTEVPEPLVPVADIPLSLFDGKAVLAHSPASGTFLHQYVAARSSSLTPEEFNLPLAMLAIAMISGRRCQLEDPEGAVLPNMGLVLVGTSGDGKTNSIKALKALLRAVDPAGSERLGVNIDKNVISGQELVHTFIKVDKDLETGITMKYPIRALLEYPEFSGFFGSTKMTGSSLKTFLHELLDGDEYLGYGSRAAGGKVIAENAFGCVVSTVQTDMLASLFTRDDAASGFMNRFIFVMGSEKEQVGINRAIIDTSGYTSALAGLKAFCHGMSPGKPILWSPDAEALYNRVFKEYLKPIKDADRRALLKRVDLYCKRFCLIFAINERSMQVLPHHVMMAQQMMIYLVPTSNTISENVFVADSNDIGDWLVRRISELEALSRKKDEKKEHHGPTMGMLKREYRQKKWTDEAVKKARDTLVAMRIITVVTGGGKRGIRNAEYHYVVEPD